MTTFRCLFRIVCVMLSISATIWPIYLFGLDEDSVEIGIKEMHLSEDIFYPSLTLCFNQPQDQYDRPILHIDDYVGNIVVKRKSKKPVVFTKVGIKHTPYDEIPYKGISRKIVLRRYQSSDCLDIGIPFRKKEIIHSMDVEIRKDVFQPQPISTRNDNNRGASSLTIGLSFQGDVFPLPNQNLNYLELDNKGINNCSGISFHVKEMEILLRRNKPSNPCIDFDRNGAFRILKYATNRLGCMPHGWEINYDLPNCRAEKLNKTDEQHYNQLLATLHYFYYKPITKFCRSIRGIQIEHISDDSIDSCKDDNDTIHITSIYDSFPFRETKLVRAYTVWNLVSNIGVIVGLFFGVSVIQLPSIFTKLRRKISGKTYSIRKTNFDDMNNKLSLANEEIHNIKEDTYILKNHILDLLQKREYESTV